MCGSVRFNVWLVVKDKLPGKMEAVSVTAVKWRSTSNQTATLEIMSGRAIGRRSLLESVHKWALVYIGGNATLLPTQEAFRGG